MKGTKMQIRLENIGGRTKVYGDDRLIGDLEVSHIAPGVLIVCGIRRDHVATVISFESAIDQLVAWTKNNSRH